MYCHKVVDKASSSQAAIDCRKLVENIISGDKDAEQALVAQYWRSLYFILTKRSQDPSLAEDIAQETFIAVVHNIRSGKLNNPEALGKYIRETGCNLLLAHYRKETRRNTSTDDQLCYTVPDNSPDIYRLMYSQQGLQLVLQLIKEMSQSRDVEVLLSFFLYGKGKSLICDELELSSDNFDRVLHRARERLKQKIASKLENGHRDLTIVSSTLLIFMAILGFSEESQKNIEKNQVLLRENTPIHHLMYQERYVTASIGRFIRRSEVDYE